MLMPLSQVLLAVLAAGSARAAPQAASTTAAAPSSSSTSSPSGQACNNSPSLCGRQYNAVTHMGAHNSAFLRDSSTGNSLAGNQFRNATAALDAGLRLLQAQVHKPNTTLELCHTSCNLLDAGPLEAWLQDINAWVAAHPSDVVTLLLVNSNSAPASDYGAVFESAGLAKVAYRPQSNAATSTWPTLQSMISADARVVTFVTNMDYSASAPYLLPEFDHVFETPFEVTALDGFNCTVSRPSRASPASGSLSSGFMSLVNHFKYQSLVANIQVPDVGAIDTVNSAGTSEPGNLGTHLQQCRTEWNKAPSFVLVDFWDKGDPIAALDGMNAVTDATGRTSSRSAGRSAGSGLAKDEKLGAGAFVAFVSAALFLL
ncbi:PLC-like phosphodiesterase, TIM beta/alpha-barrel domain protein [Metarhizium album ARSEF 1941]|uniref:PLC-like phosphodiesterase, TIM beta/alpha-barrel domain protein n=1 Tax=Metarhizium album (strain ARSEF 1941) TaxID=1081103 RepID=A0A0B2WZJ2_METAS|nr:PLC-like phosphodiesterase, TIM beta/alpha-barrel domain protein [Metarhizium album ARSEF 1941]KHN99468.1 PLC-like phosphodiesterase, TIM beta/alpha-barrel domain protein [Metarhizium album ARSEF 1941]